MVNYDSEKKAFEMFLKAGMTPAGAAGLIGNLQAESDGFFANRVEYLCLKRLKESGKIYTDESYTADLDSGKISCEEFLHPLPGKQYGYGLAQWTSPGRKIRLWNYAHEKGVSIANIEMQLEFLLKELNDTYEHVMQVLKTSTSIRSASDYVLRHFEQPAGITETYCKCRAERGQKFYDTYKKEVEKVSVTANNILDIMRGWIGRREYDGSHKAIIDIYNSHKPLARGYAVGYTDSWCDVTVSAAAIKAGAVDLIGTECGVEEHVQIFKKKGIWIEDGTITPKPGDIIVYNWDQRTQPNNGYADHIGVVESVANGIITTIEGNYQDSVRRRKISVGNGYIRGYARPKYGQTSNGSTNSSAGGKYMFEVKTVQKGSTGNDVKLLQRLLKSNGCKGMSGEKLSIDGDCGDNTEYAIKQYQKKKGLSSDGVAGEATWKSILLR